jgi:hypothetical protein
MSNPFQFSMRRMFVAVVCLSITAFSLYPFAHGAHGNGVSPYLCVPLGFTSAGAGIGMLIGHGIKGAIIGLALAALLILRALMVA